MGADGLVVAGFDLTGESVADGLRHEQIVAISEVDGEPVVVFGLAIGQADSQILEDGDDELDVFALDGVSAVTIIGVIDLTVAVDNLNASRIAHRSAAGKGVSHDIKMLIVLIVQFIDFYTVHKEFVMNGH